MATADVAINSVKPSGAALATNSRPMTVPAPGLLTTISGGPSSSAIARTKDRPITSVPPPDAKGTTTRIKALLFDWANAAGTPPLCRHLPKASWKMCTGRASLACPCLTRSKFLPRDGQSKSVQPLGIGHEQGLERVRMGRNTSQRVHQFTVVRDMRVIRMWPIQPPDTFVGEA